MTGIVTVGTIEARGADSRRAAAIRIATGASIPIGMAARLAASLRAWPMLRFEVTEEATGSTDGERLAYVPGRGFHRSALSANGDVVVGEERIRGLLSRAKSADEFAHGLHEMLGSSWDAELEPYRLTGDGSPVILLHKVV